MKLEKGHGEDIQEILLSSVINAASVQSNGDAGWDLYPEVLI